MSEKKFSLRELMTHGREQASTTPETPAVPLETDLEKFSALVKNRASLSKEEGVAEEVAVKSGDGIAPAQRRAAQQQVEIATQALFKKYQNEPLDKTVFDHSFWPGDKSTNAQKNMPDTTPEEKVTPVKTKRRLFGR